MQQIGCTFVIKTLTVDKTIKLIKYRCSFNNNEGGIISWHDFADDILQQKYGKEHVAPQINVITTKKIIKLNKNFVEVSLPYFA